MAGGLLVSTRAPRSMATHPLALGSQMNEPTHFGWNHWQSKAPCLDRGRHTCYVTAGNGPAQWPPLRRPRQHAHRQRTSEPLDGAGAPSTCLTEASQSDNKDLGLPSGGGRRGVRCMTVHVPTCLPGPQPRCVGSGGRRCLRARGTHLGNPVITGFTGQKVHVVTHGSGAVTDAHRSRTPGDRGLATESGERFKTNHRGAAWNHIDSEHREGEMEWHVTSHFRQLIKRFLTTKRSHDSAKDSHPIWLHQHVRPFTCVFVKIKDKHPRSHGHTSTANSCGAQ